MAHWARCRAVQVRAAKSSAFRAKTAVQALRSHHLWNDALNLMEVLAQRRALQDVPMDLCVALCQESQLWRRALKLQEMGLKSLSEATTEGRMKEAAQKGWQAVAELVSGNMRMNPAAAHMAMKALSARYCWRLAVELTTKTADADSALINQAASTCVRSEHWQEALAILSQGPTGPASSVAAGVALDAAQKGQAWQLALLMLAGLRYRPADAEI